MNTTNPASSLLRLHKLRQTRILMTVLMTALWTVVAPITPLHNGALDIQRAEGAEALAPTPKEFAASIANSKYGWVTAEIKCLNILWGKESAWNPSADNPHSTAFGIAQMLGETATDSDTQIRNGLRYIQHRYETPCNAWEFWERNGYY